MEDGLGLGLGLGPGLGLGLINWRMKTMGKSFEEWFKSDYKQVTISMVEAERIAGQAAWQAALANQEPRTRYDWSKAPEWATHAETFFFNKEKHNYVNVDTEPRPVAPWEPKEGERCVFWDDFDDLEPQVGVIKNPAKGYYNGWKYCAALESLDEIGKPVSYFKERGRWK